MDLHTRRAEREVTIITILTDMKKNVNNILSAQDRLQDTEDITTINTS